jgi:hypothetical protein
MRYRQPGGDSIGGVSGFESTLHAMSCLMAHACGLFDIAISHAKLGIQVNVCGEYCVLHGHTYSIQKAKQEFTQSICVLYLLLLYLQTGATDMVYSHIPTNTKTNTQMQTPHKKMVSYLFSKG